MSKFAFRIHPAIGIARLGNSEEYYLAPETLTGMPVEGDDEVTGGLPIKPGTEAEMITSADLRDNTGALKRQAVRFRIFQYENKETDTYPSGDGEEIQIGSVVEGKKVKDIIWTVHLANKKANGYHMVDSEGIMAYENGNLPPLRNQGIGPDPTNAARLKKLIIDPGPRTIKGTDINKVKFNKETSASYLSEDAKIIEQPNYPKSFPDDHFSNLFCSAGNITTLGELETDAQGRLLVLGAHGKACGQYKEDGTVYPLDDDDNNDGWFDDTADGSVCATLIFEDEESIQAHSAWVIATDPSYAPQILNPVSLWDDVYDTWIRKLKLSPKIYDNRFQKTYKPNFEDQLYPIFKSASLMRWTSNLPDIAIQAHDAVGKIKAEDKPEQSILAGLAYIRNPNNTGEIAVGPPLMPLSLGDCGKEFLTPTYTQYFFLTQWHDHQYEQGASPKLGPGEYLDRCVFSSGIGGRLSPGIDMTFIIRQPDIWVEDWETSNGGPFRIYHKPLNYQKAQANQPFLTEGYIPLHSGATGLEPGDFSKFMAVPWQTDYNSCATHVIDPNPRKSTTLFWSWPAQRPIAVYAAQDVNNGHLGAQRYSVRGKGTETDDQANAGRYQERIGMVENWHHVGFIIQGNAIDSSTPFSADYYLEVKSQLDPVAVPPWPMNADRYDE